jgi:hypothetical protein
MTLIACPDCGKQVSDQAPACIHCGKPLAPVPDPDPPAKVLYGGQVRDSPV